MEEDRQKWDRKWSEKTEAGQPLDLLHKALAVCHSPGKALDLACGRGRHSRLLAQAGFQVDAVDISPIALQSLVHPNIQTLQVDLDTFRPTANTYDLVVNTYFLDRSLFQSIKDCLTRGGWLAFETVLAQNTSISTPQFKLAPGELKEAFQELHIHFYEEVDGVARLLAQRV